MNNLIRKVRLPERQCIHLERNLLGLHFKEASAVGVLDCGWRVRCSGPKGFLNFKRECDFFGHFVVLTLKPRKPKYFEVYIYF